MAQRDMYEEAPDGAALQATAGVLLRGLSGLDVGISLTDLDRRRVNTARSAGLGLATAYSTVTGCDGAIDVKSEPGKGSVLTVYLPVAECDGSTTD